MRSKEESAILIPNCVIIPLITAPCVWQIIPLVERLESKARLKDAVIFESRIFSRNDDRLYRFISYLNVLSADEFSMNDEDNAGNELRLPDEKSQDNFDDNRCRFMRKTQTIRLKS